MKTDVTIGLVNKIALLALIVFSLFSCIPQNKLEYLQGKSKSKESFKIADPAYQRIMPGDELYIRASSFDDVNYNFFTAQNANTQLSFSNDVSVSLISYTVNDSGYVYFPILGSTYLNGLTMDEATNKLIKLLSEYFNQPTVLIKIVNKKINILGEVALPGSFTYTKDRLNIFEALSMAGDITVHGNRNNVTIIRQVNDTIQKYELNLTDKNIFLDENYNLQRNDVVYVKPLRNRIWGITSTPWNIILTSVTTFILVLSYLNN
jgi:polysaccharide export outer membrane protein